MTTPGELNSPDDKWFPSLKGMIKKDQDGIGFIDIFHFPANDSINKQTCSFFQKAGAVLTGLINTPGVDLCAWSKIVWLANEYNIAQIMDKLKINKIAIPQRPIDTQKQ